LASVRWIIAIVSLLLAAGWLACQLEASPSSSSNQLVISQWRRTVNGWERLIPAPTTPLSHCNDLSGCLPHPVVLSLLEGMLSILVLVAFSPCAKAADLSEQTVQDQLRKKVANLSEIELRSRTWLCNPSNS
jgi:hypothetical protein